MEQFASWDEGEPDPADWFLPAPDIDVFGHTLSIKRDLLYLTTGGYLVRQLWTDTQVRVTDRPAQILAAAILHYCDTDLGEGRVEAVEAWQLRSGTTRRWTRAQLNPFVPVVGRILDSIEAAVVSGS